MAIILSGPQWVNMNQVFMLVYSRSVTMPKTRPELIAGATSAADGDDADQCRRWANVAMLAGYIYIYYPLYNNQPINQSQGQIRTTWKDYITYISFKISYIGQFLENRPI